MLGIYVFFFIFKEWGFLSERRIGMNGVFFLGYDIIDNCFCDKVYL